LALPLVSPLRPDDYDGACIRIKHVNPGDPLNTKTPRLARRGVLLIYVSGLPCQREEPIPVSRIMLPVGLGTNRQENRECRPSPVLAAECDSAAQGPGQLSRNAESKPGSAELARARLIHLPEVVPDGGQVFLAYPDPAVGNIQPNQIALLLRQERDSSRVCELHRVGKQVQHDLLDLGAIGHHVQRLVRTDPAVSEPLFLD